MKHRTAVVTAASVAGALLAGAAALGANLGVLGSSDLGNLSAVDPSSPSPDVVTVYVDDPATSTTTSPASEVLAYDVPGAGIVTLERTGDTLRVAGVELVNGWSSTVQREGTDVVISLVGAKELTFSAQVVDGQVVVSVDEVPPAISASPGFEDDDRYEGEEHDDGHEASEHEGWGDDD